jgi:hypothetical protein
MKILALPALPALVLGMFLHSPVPAKDLAQLKILYVGPEREAEYEAFLKPKVAEFAARARQGFDPAAAAPYDVVILDWPQGGGEFPPKASPLGDRGVWRRPTVLLGSAGLNLAIAWQLKGGIGCTCLDPAAYGLRQHEIFERPFRIERVMSQIPTPPDFRAEIKEPSIPVLPLVAGYDGESHGRPGWCSYSTDFADNPDVEFFCGGVNHKTPAAAALWRQGNLLHFGFQQSPAEMNEQGRGLLLNSIAYISRFTEDQPIAVTPSVFAVPGARSRSTVARWARGNPRTWVREIVSPELWERLSPMSEDEFVAWADAKSRFLRLGEPRETVAAPKPPRRGPSGPAATRRLEIDEELSALGVPFDAPDFFDKAIAGLRSADATAVSRANRLLERYAPCGPKGGADAWAGWWKENKAYAFASDAGDYRWYVDPLAKKRGVPTKELRGSIRADLPAGTTGR